MIGNDIIDLQAAKRESNWKRKGFLEKLFIETEQQDILLSEYPFLWVWLLWSMKEAAYKCYVQKYQKRFFAPKKFVCKIRSKTKGIVCIENEIYYIKTTITNDYIHSIASTKEVIKSDNALLFIDNPSNQYRREVINQNLMNSFSKITDKEHQKLRLFKNEFGVPKLISDGQQTEYSFSISHHGNYGGFAILR